MKPSLVLPGHNGQANITFEAPDNVVIVGANGSGKTRLGAWIEVNNPYPDKIHRISAQRNLTVPDFVPIKSEEDAEKELLFGNAQYGNNKAGYRWGNDPFTFLLNDYDKMLSVLFAKEVRRDAEYVQLSKNRLSEAQETNAVILQQEIPKSPIEKLLEIWDDLFPHRKIILEDAKVKVAQPGTDTTYPGKQMSDGERVALYLIGQTLCVPANSILIIDEPEVHLHRSLMSRLWTKLEEAQPECLFVYITHDLEFASSRIGAIKIHLHGFNGTQFQWNEVPQIEELPESLVLDIVGNRKRVLFVEGEAGSFDIALYEALYPSFYVIPRGSCTKVIESTKALRNNSGLHWVDAYGLIDRDYRSEQEIKALEEHFIYTADVAEVENLFCVPEVLRVVANYLGFKDIDGKIGEVVTFILAELAKELDYQISNHTVAEIKYRLSLFETREKGQSAIANTLQEMISFIDVTKIYNRSEDLFESILYENNIEKALRYYNRKSLPSRIGKVFELSQDAYPRLVLRLLKMPEKQLLVQSLLKYLPHLPNDL